MKWLTRMAIRAWRAKSGFVFFLLLEPNIADAQYTFTRPYRWPIQSSGGPDYTQLLLEGSDGMLYGVAQYPLTSNTEAIFRIRKDGTGYQVLRSQSLQNLLFGGLLEASNGKLYGFYWNPGSASSFDWYRLCRMNKDGTQFEVLRRLPLDLGTQWTGLQAQGLRFETTDGWLYGGFGPESGFGVQPVLGGGVFRCRLDGSQFTMLHIFGSVTNDGRAGVPQFLGNDGRIYGSCGNGGNTTNLFGEGGTIWRMEQDGSGYQILHDFNGPPGGLQQPTVLVEDAGGSLVGFADNGRGLFRLNKDGSGYAEVLRFGATATAGIIPWGISGRVDGAGFTYGSSPAGGRYGLGVVFRIRLDGTGFAILYHFGATSRPDEEYAGIGLISKDDSFYGSHWNVLPGDEWAQGIFRLTPPRLQLSATRDGDLLRLTATGSTNIQWRLESSDAMAGTNAWQPLTNITLDQGPIVLDQPLNSPSRFYRGVWMP